MSARQQDMQASKTAALLAKARARQGEAAAARHQAQAYEEAVKACRERVLALQEAAAADEDLARNEDNPTMSRLASLDAHRAAQQALLFETLAKRHEIEVLRLHAEAERAESEAATALVKANPGMPADEYAAIHGTR
ncbi:hypothetical protein [Archangium violaceum]|uniref:hypothetical protein n=1 Tax=Archangium violaceum TaxID=83451 RepID=UPI0036DEF904